MTQTAAPPSRLSVRLTWVSTALSVLILGAFVIFYFLHDRRRTAESVERDLRLLGIGSDALRQSLGGAHATGWLGHDDCKKGVWVEVPPLPASEETGAPASPPNSFCLEFEDIVRFVPRGEQAFDSVLLVDEQDHIWGQAGRAEAPHLGSLGALKIFVDGKASVDSVQLSKAGSITAVHFGSGEKYRLFCQAGASAKVYTETDPAKASRLLQLCGLASEDRLHARWQLSEPLVFSLCALLILTVLIPPFLRMKLLSPTQRFRFADAFALGVCILFAIMLLTVVVQGVVTRHRLDGLIDRQLARLANALGDKVDDELGAARRQLERAEVSQEPGVHSSSKGQWPEYPYVESVSFADKDGDLRWKFTTLDVNKQSLVSVAERPYFQHARASDEPVFESVRSYSSGKSRMIVAQREDDDEPGVMIIAFALKSLRVALPDGTSAAVVDNSGNVLAHSEPSLANSHNVLTECNEDSSLRNRLERNYGAGESGLVESLSYFGVNHRAYVRTLDVGKSPSHLSLIVFEESSAPSSVVYGTLLGGLQSSLKYTSVWVAVGLVCVLFGGRKRIAWLWPSEGHRTAYAALFFWFLVLVAATFVYLPRLVELRSREEAGLSADASSPALQALASHLEPFAIALPLLVLLSTLLVFWGERTVTRRTPRMRAARLPLWRAYCLTATAFLFLCAVIPPFVFSSLAMDEGARRYADHRAASFQARVVEPDEDFTSRENELARKAHYRPPGEYAGALGLDPGGAASFAETLVHTLHGTSADTAENESAQASFTAHSWGAFVVFTALLIFAIVRWLANTVLLRGVDAAPRVGASALQGNDGNLWCVVASLRTIERLTGDGAADGLYVGKWFGPRPDAGLWRALRDRGEKPCLIAANQTPLHALRALEAEKYSAPEVERGVNALRDFRTGYLRDPHASRDEALRVCDELTGKEGKPSSKKWLTRELSSSVYVLEACRRLPRARLARAGRGEQERLVKDTAWNYYWELWNACSSMERLTLVQLAEEGFINERRREVVRALLGRGLVTRRPMLAPFNESFASFVRIQGAELGVRTWEAPPLGLSWQHFRAPLFALFACSAYALFFTQRDIFDSTVLYATTLAALVPHLGRFAATAVPALSRVSPSPVTSEPSQLV